MTSCSRSRIPKSRVLVVDADAFRDRGGDLAATAPGLTKVFTLGRASYGVDLLALVEAAGSASPRCLAAPDDVATLNYTGGTTGKSKGALRHHRENASYLGSILADFEIPDAPRYLAVAPISHVAGTKVLPTLMRGGVPSTCSRASTPKPCWPPSRAKKSISRCSYRR